MKRKIAKDVLRQIRIRRSEAENNGEEWNCTVGSNKKVEYAESTLDIKNRAVEQRRVRRQERASLRRNAREARITKIEEENITTAWFFVTGDLVVVKKSTRSYSGRPPAGSIAMIVDTADHTDHRGVENVGSTVTVMFEGKVENWPAKWVKHCE